MIKYFSRKFILTLIGLIGCLVFVFISNLSGTEMASVIGSIAALIGQYNASNAFARGKNDT